MRDTYGLERLTKKYEKKLQNEQMKLFKERDFHISQLRELIENVDPIMDIVGEEISELFETVRILNENFDANTIFKKIELYWLRKFSYVKYKKRVEEFLELDKVKDRLIDILEELESYDTM